MMTIFVSRWAVDRKKDKYLYRETTSFTGSARQVMAAFKDLKNRSDLFGFTAWEIYNITDD